MFRNKPLWKPSHSIYDLEKILGAIGSKNTPLKTYPSGRSEILRKIDLIEIQIPSYAPASKVLTVWWLTTQSSAD